MPQVTTAKARKDYPREGIRKGDTYYSWAFYRQPTMRSKTYPKPSQLCNNKFSGALSAMEDLEVNVQGASDPDDLKNAVEEAVAALESVRDEFNEAIDNMEQAFQGGSPQIEEQTEQRDNIETCIGELEALEFDDLDASDYADDQEDKGKNIQEFADLGTLGQSAYMDELRNRVGEVSLS